MPEYVAEDFRSAVDKYYEAKTPYTQLLHNAAAREPSENDRLEQERPANNIWDDRYGWPGQNVSEDTTGSPRKLDTEAIEKIMQEMKIKGVDVDGKQGSKGKKGPNK